MNEAAELRAELHEAQRENAKLHALLDKVGMDRAGTAGTLMGAEAEVTRLKLQNDELIGWLREVHSLAMVHDLAPSLARDIRAISENVAKYVDAAYLERAKSLKLACKRCGDVIPVGGHACGVGNQS